MTRGSVVALALLLLTGCSQEPVRPSRVEGDGGSLKSLEARPAVIIHEPRRRVELEEAIAAYQALIDAGPDPALRRAALRRAADLQFELAERRSADEERPPDDAAYTAAIARYEALLAAYPDYPEADAVLYQLAKAYDRIARPRGALEALTRLAAQYPDSPYAGEAQFRRGEILFVQRRYREAETAYRAVIGRGEQTRFSEQALYKLGWTLLKQGRDEEAAEIFFQALDLRLGGRHDRGVLSLEELPPAERELVEDTLRAIAVSLGATDAGREEKAVAAYLARPGREPYGHLIYRALGERHLAHQQFFAASELYKGFVARHPTHPEAPRFLIGVIDLYDRLGLGSLAWAARQEFADRYGSGSPFWRAHSPAEYPRVTGRLQTVMRELAQRAHARAQESGRAADVAEALRRYRDYLAFFPDAPEAPEARFLLAELLFENGDYAAAAEAYERFAYANTRDGRAAEAAYAALLAYEKVMAAAGSGEQEAWRRRFVDSAMNFVARFPAHPEAATVSTRLAEQWFAEGAVARAREMAERVVRRAPPAPAVARRTAWTVIGHIDYDRGDYQAAERAYRAALELTSPAGGQRTALGERLAAAIYRQGEQARDAGRLQEAAGHFLRVRELTPAATIAANAEYDAAAVLLSLKQWDRAAEVLARFRARHPGHALRTEATRRLAVAYLESGRPGLAAQELARLGQESDDTGLRREALWRAAGLYEQAGQPAAAEAAYARYLAAFPQPLSQAMTARQRLARLAAARGDVARQRYWLNEIIDADARAGPARSERTRDLAARAALALADSLREACEAIPLVIPLDQSLAKKRRAMEQAIEAYGRAADYGVAGISTAATYHIAELYHDFSRAMLDSERPPELSAAAREEYDLLLEEQAFPFEEQAIQIHEANWRRVADGVYDRWVRASLEQLGALMPARYRRTEKRERVVEAIE